ncbi:MAG: hypothetical protein ACYC9W_03220 [Candidatus Limnocylindria bacterium]
MTRRIGYAFILAIGMLALAPGVALAGPEWCDDGSPPPNDFRFQQTGSESAVSSTSWLKSTTGGTLDLATGTNTLTGGVAKGMLTAILHAGARHP